MSVSTIDLNQLQNQKLEATRKDDATHFAAVIIFAIFDITFLLIGSFDPLVYIVSDDIVFFVLSSPQVLRDTGLSAVCFLV